MRRFLLDTGAASDYINRRRGVFERAREEVARGNRIGIGIPVLAELLFGIELSASRERNLQRLHVALPTLKVWPFDERAAEEY
jgi:tRNA(fMet)-specific endonuclease VapC